MMMQKCKFNQTSLSFLGHTISKDGLHPDKDRASAVAHAPAPHETCSLRSFLGLASWYSKFIPDFATIVELIRAALSDSTDLKSIWTAVAETNFTEIKKLILESPALALHDPDLPTQVTTDTSAYGLGAVLTQLQPDNTERTVAFASRTLCPAERKYSSIEREALAWVGRWRHGGPTCGDATFRTDHQAHPKGLVVLDWELRDGQLDCFVLPMMSLTIQAGKM